MKNFYTSNMWRSWTQMTTAYSQDPYVQKTCEALEEAERYANMANLKVGHFWLEVSKQWQAIGMAVSRVPSRGGN